MMVEQSIIGLEKKLMHLITLYKRLGLSDNLDDAITELDLLIGIIKAHKKYLDFRMTKC